MIHFKISIIGKVQGVFFRVSAKSKADELSIVGIVRNEVDGSVYIEAEGEKKNMDQFIAWCHKGSNSARVDNVILKEDVVKNFTRFEIRR